MSLLVDLGHASQLPTELVANALSIAVRKDTAASTTATDNTACVLQCDSTGALRTTGSGGGDASAANQSSMITKIETIATAVHVEDIAHSDGDAGIMSLFVRKDSPATLAGTSGDYAAAQVDGNGSLWVTNSGRAARSTVTIAASSWTKGDHKGSLDTQSFTNVDFAIQFSNATATAAHWLGIQISSDNSTWVELQDVGFQPVTDSSSATQFVCRGSLTGLAARYVRFTNTCATQTTLSDLYLTLH